MGEFPHRHGLLRIREVQEDAGSYLFFELMAADVHHGRKSPVSWDKGGHRLHLPWDKALALALG